MHDRLEAQKWALVCQMQSSLCLFKTQTMLAPPCLLRSLGDKLLTVLFSLASVNDVPVSVPVSPSVYTTAHR